uniref:NADH dehydrogenase subunit 3 n=1 Tax=Anchistus australis TaxID=1296376 RepID=UPI0013E94370|nr:NADH dehydrogenase subunit 3 [Anchistus australis]QHR79563.1 NADH dehydrogenase subunit 3 [Anchistus australis]
MVSFLSVLFAGILSGIVMFVSTLVAKKQIMDREKGTPFECGFDPKSSARLPFSLQFFLVTIIFLIFDVEITLLMPLPIIMSSSSLPCLISTSIFFLLILLLGLYHEWNQGALEWAE